MCITRVANIRYEATYSIQVYMCVGIVPTMCVYKLYQVLIAVLCFGCLSVYIYIIIPCSSGPLTSINKCRDLHMQIEFLHLNHVVCVCALNPPSCLARPKCLRKLGSLSGQHLLALALKWCDGSKRPSAVATRIPTV